MENYLKKFISKGYKSTVENLVFYQQNEINIKDENSIAIGKAYKIYELEINIFADENSKSPTSDTNDNNNKNNNNEFQSQTKTIKNKIKLNVFMENQIKALIAYYIFNENLKQNINTSRTTSECYLIDERWMKSYIRFFLGEEVIKETTNILNNPNTEKKVEKIYEQFNNEFLKKIKEKERQSILAIFQSLSSFKKENFIESADIKEIMKY